ncbi:MAG: stage II sporulation protein R [Patescibacteria group bacterium]
MFLRRAAISAAILAVLFLVALCVNGTALTHEQSELAYNKQNLIRLHIKANSDSAVDQGIKLRVRDAVLKKTRSLLLRARNPRAAMAAVRMERNALRALAASIARRGGAKYGARVEIGTYDFPARLYPFGSLPAGRYQAVRIILGRGRGDNWWCVLFPPLCLLDPGGARVKGPVRVRLLFLERLLRANGLVLDGFWRGWARFWRLPAEA